MKRATVAIIMDDSLLNLRPVGRQASKEALGELLSSALMSHL